MHMSFLLSLKYNEFRFKFLHTSRSNNNLHQDFFSQFFETSKCNFRFFLKRAPWCPGAIYPLFYRRLGYQNMCSWYLRSCVYIIVHLLILYLFIQSCYYCLFYVVIFVVWLSEPLMGIPIRLVLVSASNPRSSISVFESASGHYPFRSESDEKTWYKIW
jgi:hypothetical protein